MHSLFVVISKHTFSFASHRSIWKFGLVTDAFTQTLSPVAAKFAFFRDFRIWLTGPIHFAFPGKHTIA